MSNFLFCHYVFKKPSAAEASESVFMKERVQSVLQLEYKKKFNLTNFENMKFKQIWKIMICIWKYHYWIELKNVLMNWEIAQLKQFATMFSKTYKNASACLKGLIHYLIVSNVYIYIFPIYRRFLTPLQTTYNEQFLLLPQDYD